VHTLAAARMPAPGDHPRPCPGRLLCASLCFRIAHMPVHAGGDHPRLCPCVLLRALLGFRAVCPCLCMQVGTTHAHFACPRVLRDLRPRGPPPLAPANENTYNMKHLMQHTSQNRWNIWNIRLQHMQHLNKHLQHTFETVETYICNIHV
jgi:hypothetical protein